MTMMYSLKPMRGKTRQRRVQKARYVSCTRRTITDASDCRSLTTTLDFTVRIFIIIWSPRIAKHVSTIRVRLLIRARHIPFQSRQ